MSIDRQSVLNKLGWCQMVSSATGIGGVTVDAKTIEECKALIEELIMENEDLKRLRLCELNKANDLACDNALLRSEVYTVRSETIREMQERLKEGFRKYGRANWSVRAIIDQIAKEMNDEK